MNIFLRFSESNVFDECDIPSNVKEKLLEDIRKKLTPQALKIRTDIEVSCFAYEGIEAVKAALVKGKECSTEEMPIKVLYQYTFINYYWKIRTLSPSQSYELN